jgi:hypothetical protein
MSKRIAFRIFLVGTVSSSLLFLFLTFDTHRQVAAQSYMRLWMGVTMVAGFFFLAGVATTVFDLLTLRPARPSGDAA